MNLGNYMLCESEEVRAGVFERTVCFSDERMCRQMDVEQKQQHIPKMKKKETEKQTGITDHTNTLSCLQEYIYHQVFPLKTFESHMCGRVVVAVSSVAWISTHSKLLQLLHKHHRAVTVTLTY